MSRHDFRHDFRAPKAIVGVKKVEKKTHRGASDDSSLQGTAVRPKRIEHTLCYKPGSPKKSPRPDFYRGYGSLSTRLYQRAQSSGIIARPSRRPYLVPKPSVSVAHNKSHDTVPRSDGTERSTIKPFKLGWNLQGQPQAKTRPRPTWMNEPLLQPQRKDVRSLIKLSPEIRHQILRELLVADKPVKVYCEWKKVYKWNKPLIHINILFASRQLYHEGVRILYGENVFLYRLRDTRPAPTNINRAARDDDLSDSNELNDDVDSEYQGSDDDGDYCDDLYRPPPRWSRAATSNRLDIDLPKFLPMIRRIIVEAEFCRSGWDTRASMAKAISVFRPPRGVACNDARRPNIHTVTIRVAALGASDSLDFVDFFASDSPIMQTLKTFECQFLHVDLRIGGGLSYRLRNTGTRYTVDMRHHRISRRAQARLPDLWAKDGLMLKSRQEHVEKTGKVLDELQSHVRHRCCLYNGERVPRSMVTGWINLKDIDDKYEWQRALRTFRAAESHATHRNEDDTLLGASNSPTTDEMAAVVNPHMGGPSSGGNDMKNFTGVSETAPGADSFDTDQFGITTARASGYTKPVQGSQIDQIMTDAFGNY